MSDHGEPSILEELERNPSDYLYANAAPLHLLEKEESDA